MALGAGFASAQDEEEAVVAEAPVVDTAGTTLLDAITVVSRTGETAIDTMAAVSHLGGVELRRRMAATPQDIFFGVPGIAMQADAKRAASSVNIRGLQDFGRVQVIVDGARQNFQRSGHGTQSMFFLDPELVKQVDVVRGPVANTYGSGAIGGVVVFETKDATDFLRDGETWGLSTTARYDTNGEGGTASATGAYRFSDSFDVLGNIVWRSFDEYRDGDGATVAGSSFDILSGMAKASIRPTEFSEIKLGWVGANNTWFESGNTRESDVEQNTYTARFSVTDPDTSWLDLHVNASANIANLTQTYLVPGFQFHPVTGAPTVIPAGSMTTYDLDTYSFDAWNTSRFDTGALSHELTYGGDFVTDDVFNVSAVGGPDTYSPSGKRTVWGLYIQDKITYDWLEVIGAVRYDSYELDGVVNNKGDRLSPRITAGISPFSAPGWEGLQFYGTYAEGYRSPSVTETLISGLHPNGVVFPFLPNPNLMPETAATWELGVNYKRDGVFTGNDNLRIKAAFFDNDIENYIGGVNLSPFVPGSGCAFNPLATIPICFQYQNFAEARIRGFEFEAAYDAGHVFAGLTASIIDGYTINGAGVRADLLSIPSAQVTGSLGFRFLDEKLTLGGEVQYNGKPDGNPTAQNYTLVNLFASYAPNDTFRFDARVDNLFDVKYANPLNAGTTAVVFEPGINVRLAATMRFGG